MLGNVAEWTLDAYGPYPRLEEEKDPTGAGCRHDARRPRGALPQLSPALRCAARAGTPASYQLAPRRRSVLFRRSPGEPVPAGHDVQHPLQHDFDHGRIRPSRERGLLRRKVAEIAWREAPVDGTGDLISTPDSGPYLILTSPGSPDAPPWPARRRALRARRSRTTAWRGSGVAVQGDRARAAHRLRRPRPAWTASRCGNRHPVRHVRRPLPLRTPAVVAEIAVMGGQAARRPRSSRRGRLRYRLEPGPSSTYFANTRAILKATTGGDDRPPRERRGLAGAPTGPRAL